MEKSIKITAVLAVVSELAYVIIGRILIPLVGGIIYGNSLLSYSNNPVLILEGMGAYYLVSLAGIIIPILYIVFMIMLIGASKSINRSIVPEVLGIIVMGAVMPILTLIFNLIVSASIYRILMIINWDDSLPIYNMMGAYGGFLSILSTIALVLITISFTVSICRKKTMDISEFTEE